MQLSRQFEEDVSDARRTLSAAQVEEEQYRLEMGALKDRISKQGACVSIPAGLFGATKLLLHSEKARTHSSG